MSEASELLAQMREAAAVGAELVERSARHVTGRRISFTAKGSAIDLVTDVDRAAEKAIVAILVRTGIAVVAEEGARTGGASNERDDAVFYVDPLDGTTCYAHGHPFHCVSIGLVRAGVPVLGVVHAPMLGVVWSGGPEVGATRRDVFRGIEHALAVSEVDTLDAALCATGFPYDRRTSDDDNLAAFTALTKRAQGVLRCGSAALDLALVADGTYDAYWERKLEPWDAAAGGALLLAAGGRLTDPRGAPFAIGSGSERTKRSVGLAASNGRIHDELLAAIAPHLPPG